MIETIEIRNPTLPSARCLGMPETYRLTGEIIPNPRWAGPDKIAMMVADRYTPLRIIQKSNIIGKYYEPKIVAPVVKTWKVSGSKNNTYIVTADAGRFSCTCVGYQFRHECKHINQVKAA